jgi:hypothetical protein
MDIRDRRNSFRNVIGKRIDPQELKDEGITEEEYIQDVFNDEFISEAENLLQKDWEAGKFEDAVKYDQDLENVEGDIVD